MGHGHMEKHFYPKATGQLKGMKLPPAWKSMKQNLAHTTMISNLTNKQNKQPHNGSEALFSCCNVNGFVGKARHNSISCDQVAAAHWGKTPVMKVCSSMSETKKMAMVMEVRLFPTVKMAAR